ncbi:DUF3693 domain-containing protein [Vibrio litoralis]|uniref:DUF3693 domain-containing protein n=1 Tax=Vibrio litoralis TaxID=335972 RepID=UPI000405F01D|nr:DUF3693 domain-containing protein [Vibrio litoralis]
MYQKQLLEAYKKAKKYTQDKQIAHDLNLNKSRITELKKGQRYLTDNEAVFLAEEAGIEPEVALLACHADRNENEKIKALWEHIAKKFNSVEFAKLSMVCGSFVALLNTVNQGMNECALRILC